MEQLGPIPWKYSDPTRRIRSNVVSAQQGHNWMVSWGGISAWEKVNESDPHMSDFAIGDFDGDHRANIFSADGQTWWVSSGA